MSSHGIGGLQDCKILPIASDAVVDTANFEGVMFVNDFVTPAGANKLTLRDGDASDGSDQADIDDSAGDPFAEITGRTTERVLVLQCHKPKKRFLSVTASGGTMVAILYGARNQPTIQDATLTYAESFVSPSNPQPGTAR